MTIRQSQSAIELAKFGNYMQFIYHNNRNHLEKTSHLLWCTYTGISIISNYIDILRHATQYFLQTSTKLSVCSQSNLDCDYFGNVLRSTRRPVQSTCN